ncbi:hypothetical protein BH09VER1_BH09VER1_54200 [soil metagenome]
MPEGIEFSEFAEIAATLVNGQPPVVVGGQAVNIWALFYLSKVEEQLRPHAPFVSKDLDLYGSRQILEGLAEKYAVSVKWNPPRFPGVGQLIIPMQGRELKVELLSSVKGLRSKEAASAIDLTVQGVALRVLDPITCLKAKLANAADLDQTNRQDVKHVSIMKVCVREFAKDIMERAEQQLASERAVIDCLQDIMDIAESPNARLVTKKWAIGFEDVLPWDAIGSSPLQKVQNFRRYRRRQDS